MSPTLSRPSFLTIFVNTGLFSQCCLSLSCNAVSSINTANSVNSRNCQFGKFCQFWKFCRFCQFCQFWQLFHVRHILAVSSVRHRLSFRWTLSVPHILSLGPVRPVLLFRAVLPVKSFCSVTGIAARKRLIFELMARYCMSHCYSSCVYSDGYFAYIKLSICMKCRH